MKIDIERLQEELVETKSNLALVNRLSLANGDFIWEVRNFNACLSDARCNLRDSMYSEAFSTGNPGYKLCVRVNLDGVDDRSRNYLSVYVHLMQGEYDNAMKWPFNRRIKISVLDRNPVRGERRNITDILSPQPNITALQRPKEWKSPQGYGFAKFVSISRLSSRYYLAGDILAIRIRVLS
ncbi:uncharacterized protein TRIADDRAFT_32844 [Trichoplax adhaerens]|uniref:MATH domain-containing protein n=1 Tax=Trichoplax adhaerens TaxID=10228 RepID=B3SBI6_TRIAD|nr:hypothetical protein TRIADDRAFT_32844 [Trichoplax adhaerens]EDV19899.1 hypothetical protein TRIADDRAFT_32844 [Trichoplax adhaerens]|eukprot:XP_002117641.1 hypothetical protein TRIADDRAFT_32844 [Trichoplax adhaerens]